MSTLTLTKRIDGAMVAANEEDALILDRLRIGDSISASWKKKRNAKFHRKFFAMLDVGFNAFEPEEYEYNGIPAQKSRERFRKDVICQAGYYELVVNLRGEVRAEAKSISFSKMGEDEFEELYSQCANVLLQKVLRNYTREDLDQQVAMIIGFC